MYTYNKRPKAIQKVSLNSKLIWYSSRVLVQWGEGKVSDNHSYYLAITRDLLDFVHFMYPPSQPVLTFGGYDIGSAQADITYLLECFLVSNAFSSGIYLLFFF